MYDFRIQSDALVIGAGIAGTTVALSLAEQGLDVILLTTGDHVTSGNTALAQGGIVYRAEEDEPSMLGKDILTAGWKQNNTKAVRHLCKEGPEALRKILLEKYPVPFSKNESGKWNMTREGGHSLARILYCADHTGKNIMETLEAAASAHPNIRVLTKRTAIDLLTTHHHADHLDFKYNLNNQCVGAYVFNEEVGQIETLFAPFTVLATGGVGQVYLHTTNTDDSIGSGVAMGLRAGARLYNCEYMQFHPTALFGGTKQGKRRFLVSEAVRGEGARLVDSNGNPFMHRYDQRLDLAPRDIVTRAIMDEMLHSGSQCVYLDAATRSKVDPAKRFPTIYEKCLSIGVDMREDLVPVVPAAHYFCGGVLVDTRGRTTLERLYAAGECSCTGVHGANRLASTSLLEGLLWGNAVGKDIASRAKRTTKLSRKLTDSIPDWKTPSGINNQDPALIAQDWTNIRSTMWNYVGITRTTSRLKRAFYDLQKLNKNLEQFYRETPLSKELIGLFHGCQTAHTITLAALRNKKTSGCHHRAD